MTWFDIYVFTPRRNRETLWLFIERYAEQSTLTETIGAADLLLLPATAKSFDEVLEADLTLVKVTDLDGLIELGIGDVLRCFWIYLAPMNKSHKSIVIKFTSDGCLVFGVAVAAFKDYEDGQSNYEEALALKHKMATEFGSELATIQCYQPPPDNKEDMLLLMRESEITE